MTTDPSTSTSTTNLGGMVTTTVTRRRNSESESEFDFPIKEIKQEVTEDDEQDQFGLNEVSDDLLLSLPDMPLRFPQELLDFQTPPSPKQQQVEQEQVQAQQQQQPRQEEEKQSPKEISIPKNIQDEFYRALTSTRRDDSLRELMMKYPKYAVAYTYPDKFQRTLLHYAAGQGWEASVNYCVSKLGMDVNLRAADLETPLHRTARFGKVDVCKRLIKLGADLNSQDEKGNTPLHTAGITGKGHIIRELLSHSALDADIKNLKGQNACVAAEESRTSNPDAINCLRDFFADRETRNSARAVAHTFSVEPSNNYGNNSFAAQYAKYHEDVTPSFMKRTSTSSSTTNATSIPTSSAVSFNTMMSTTQPASSSSDPRASLPRNQICQDGHRTATYLEFVCDNIMRENRIFHDLEPQLILVGGEKVFPAFFLPDFNIYVEVYEDPIDPAAFNAIRYAYDKHHLQVLFIQGERDATSCLTREYLAQYQQQQVRLSSRQSRESEFRGSPRRKSQF